MLFFIAISLLLALGDIASSQPPAMLTGFPIPLQRLTWEDFDYGFWDRGPIIADITGDSEPEILVMASDPDWPTHGASRILVFNASHTEPNSPLFTLSLPPNLIQDGFHFSHMPIVADGDGDGFKEVVAGAWVERSYDWNCPWGTGGHVSTCFHWYSYIICWEFENQVPSITISVQFEDRLLAMPTVGDVVGSDTDIDGCDDLLFAGVSAVGYTQFGGAALGFFSIFRWINSQWVEVSLATRSGYIWPPRTTQPTLYDMTGDGIPEIFVNFVSNEEPPDPEGDEPPKLMVFDPTISTTTCLDSVVVPHWNAQHVGGEYGNMDLPPAVLADIDLDGRCEAIFAAMSEQNENSDYRIYIVSNDGNQLLIPTVIEIPVNHKLYQRSMIAVADGPSPEDGTERGLDIYLPLIEFDPYNPVQVGFEWLDPQYVFRSELGWPHNFSSTQAWMANSYCPAIVNSLIGNDAELVTQVGSQNGQQNIRSFRLDNSYGLDSSWSVAGGGFESQDRLSAVTITDLDRDGKAEMVFIAASSVNNASIVAFKLSTPYNPETIEWHGYQNGPAHTGLYAQPVSGNQPLSEMVWSGRVVVHDWYTVQAGQLLHIKPGTVVEFRPGAELYVCGKLNAVGQPHDSIYFKPDGTSDWGGILVNEAAELGMTRAVVHGAGSIYAECYGGTSPTVTIVDSRIYDMEYDSSVVSFDMSLLY